jgi:hypothetical protein
MGIGTIHAHLISIILAIWRAKADPFRESHGGTGDLQGNVGYQPRHI